MQELQDTWKGHGTAEADVKIEIDTNKVLISDQTNGNQVADAQQRELHLQQQLGQQQQQQLGEQQQQQQREDEEVERLQAELHAQLLAQVISYSDMDGHKVISHSV